MFDLTSGYCDVMAFIRARNVSLLINESAVRERSVVLVGGDLFRAFSLSNDIFDIFPLVFACFLQFFS